MKILEQLIILCWATIAASDAFGQELQVPETPRPLDALHSPLTLQPQPIDIRTKTLDEAGRMPTDRELVSILKRKLPSANETLEMKHAPEWFQNMMQRIVRENVPDKYVQDKDWGKTDKRWDGLHFKRKGLLRLTTKRRWKEVNHGTWKRYEITQRDPSENLLMRIENVHDAGRGKVGFEVGLDSKLHVHGRRAQWAKGVQIYNLSADADADVHMRLWCEVGMKLDVRKFPPDVVMVPQVTKTKLDVTEFRLQSISKLDGPIVKQLSNSIHKVLLDKIEEKSHQLPKKVNREIAKNEDKMRLSLSDFASRKWNALTGNESNGDDEVDKDTSSKPKPETREARPARSSSANEPMLATPQEPASSTFPTRSVSIEESDSELIELIGRGEDDSQHQNVGPILIGPGG